MCKTHMEKLSILKKSLKNKEAILDRKFESYFQDVNSANGQPLNDKRGGRSVLDSWDRKSDSIAKQKKEIGKTERAIAKEEDKLSDVNYWYGKMPKFLTDIIDSGRITQWRQHPRIMFVVGVDSARLVFDGKTEIVSHKYVNRIKDKEQFSIFRDLFNELNSRQKGEDYEN